MALPKNKRATQHVLFTDIRDNDNEAYRYLQGRRDTLVSTSNLRPLSDDENSELARILEILKHGRHSVVDPSFVTIRYLFETNNLGVTVNEPLNGNYNFPATQLPDVLKIAAVYGMLATDDVAPPVIKVKDWTWNGQPPIAIVTSNQATSPQHATPVHLEPDQTDPNFTIFGQRFFSAFGESDVKLEMLGLVFPILREEGDKPGRKPDEVSATELAEVVRELIANGVKPSEPQLRRRVNECLDDIQNVNTGQPSSRISIDLPDLEAKTDYSIVEDNIRALQPIYFSAMFEELKVFQVREKLAELFQNGILPIKRGHAGDALYNYWKDTAKRMSESERRSFYARTLGIPGGDDGGMPNREFSDLWLRFVSAVSSYVRQSNVDQLLRAAVAAPISDQTVRKAGRDLAVNLSLHGYGMAYWVATELQQEIKNLIDLLNDSEILAAYGAKDMWQVIDQVATLELGGAKNSVKYRTMATSGAIIMAWLATNANKLSGTTYVDYLIRIEDIRNPPPLRSGQKATTEPRTWDLSNACDQWLAVTGTAESRIEEFAQAREAPMMTSKPIAVPAIARDMLESAGVPAMGLGNRYSH
jgi:hypothetical protein